MGFHTMETAQVEQIPDFQVFKGSNYREMPKLIAKGLVPASAAQIMHGFLEGKIDRKLYHDSGDAIIYHPDNGSVKLVWDSKDLHKLNTESPLSAGALVLPDGAWELFDGDVFSRDDIEKYTGIAQSKSDVKGNPFWQWFARDDQDLLGEYVGQMLGLVKERYGYDKAMRIHVGNPKMDTSVLRLWCLGGDDYDGGSADGYNHLDGNNGRLAGVVPEAPRVESVRGRAARKNGPYRTAAQVQGSRLEETVRNALDDGHAFEYGGLLYVPSKKEKA